MAEPRPIDVEEAARSEPRGSLSIRTLGMPADTNQYGDIFGGWLLGQMDIAGGIFAACIAKGRTATVAVDAMTFRNPASALSKVGMSVFSLLVVRFGGCGSDGCGADEQARAESD